MALFKVLDNAIIHNIAGIDTYNDGDIFESDNWEWDVFEELLLEEGAVEPFSHAPIATEEEEEEFDRDGFMEEGNYVALNLDTRVPSEVLVGDFLSVYDAFSTLAEDSDALFALLHVVAVS